MSFIYNLTATFNDAAVQYNGIKLNASNGASGAAVGLAASRIINLQNNGNNLFSVDLNGLPYIGTKSLQPLLNDPTNQTSNFSIDSTFNTKSIIMTGGFFTATFPAIDATTTYFQCLLTNPLSETRAKRVVFTGASASNFFLWPGQAVVVVAVSGVWIPCPGPQRWRVPANTQTIFHVDPNTGNNATNDGLATGSGNAWANINNGILNILEYCDWRNTGQLQILGTPATTDTTTVHVAIHDIPGAQGSSAIEVNGNGMTLAPNSGEPAINTYFSTMLKISNFTLNGPLGQVAMHYGSTIWFNEGMIFTPQAGHYDVALDTGSRISFNQPIALLGGARAAFLSATQNCTVQFQNAVNFSGDTAVTELIYAQGCTVIDASTATWNLNGHAVTGGSYLVGSNSVINSSGAIPGSLGGTVVTGGQAL